MSRAFNLYAVSFGIFACFLIFLSDFKKSDFFPTPVHLVISSQYQPSTTVKTNRRNSSQRSKPLQDSLTTKVLRACFIDLTQPSTPEYLYAPICTQIFTPLKNAPPNWGLFTWQFFSMAALLASVYAIVIAHEEPKDWGMRTIVLSFAALAFLPILISLKIGKVDIPMGVLPLSIGYSLLTKRKPIAAGLILSLTLLKPPYLVPPLFLSLAMIADKQRHQCFVALCVGLLLITGIDVTFLGGSLGKELLNCFTLSYPLYANLASGMVAQLATNLPGATLLVLSPMRQLTFNPVIFTVAGLFALLALIAVVRLWLVGISEEKKIAITIIMGIFITPLVLPNFFYHNFCLYAVAGIIVVCANWSAAAFWEFKSIVTMSWVLINLYGLPLFFNKVFAFPLVLVVFLLLFYRRLLIICDTIRIVESIAEMPFEQNDNGLD